MKFSMITFLVSLLVAGSTAIAETSVMKVAANTDASPQTQTNVTNLTPEQMPLKTFTLALAMEYSQKIAVDERGARESSTDFTIFPTYQITKLVSASAKAIVSKENSGPRQTLMSDTQLSLGLKGFQLTNDLESVHSLGGAVPTSEKSRLDRFQGGVSITNGLRLTKTFATIEYKLGLSRNFHQYTINPDGEPNVEYRLSNSLTVEVPVTEKFSVSTAVVYRQGKTYRNFDRSAFEIHADLNYEIVKQFSVNLGTSNEGSSLKSNGVDSNITAYNEDSSVTRAGINLIF